MADVSKAEKLAAARKKLKEFQDQQRNKENVERTPEPEASQHPPRVNEPLAVNGSYAKQEPKNGEQIQHTNISYEAQKPEVVTEQRSLLSNYFSYPNNNFFFDMAPKNEEVRENNVQDFAMEREKATFGVPESNHIINLIKTDSSNTISEEENSFASSRIKLFEEEVQSLKQELEQALSKIKMQADALEYVTSDREELSTKFNKSVTEINSQKVQIETLQSQLAESERHRTQLNESVNELSNFKEKASAHELELKQYINDLKDKNDELQQNVEIQREKNTNLQKRFEETQSSKDMLTLKFQQLGIEINNDGKGHVSVIEEHEALKQKYAESQEQLKTLVFEKEHTVDKYRQYVENLKEELHQNSLEIQKLSSENETLQNKISSQTDHICNLEKQLQKPPAEVENKSNILALESEIERLNAVAKEYEKKEALLVEQLTDYQQLQEKLRSLENELSNAKSDMHDAHELQAAVESNKVAASQAISQNNKLKDELIRLNECVSNLNMEKDMLTRLLEEERNTNKKLIHVQSNFQNASELAQETAKNDAETNTEKSNNPGEEQPYGTANLDAMLQLQEKFKCVLNKMADLTDEKQQLEHLVTQLQCETETIEEYVALYQKQRSILQQRARETDLKMDCVIQEKLQLLSVLRTILASDNIDGSVVRELVERSISRELHYELATDIEKNGVHLMPFRSDSNHHPSCPCCSGKLITV